MSGDYTDLSIIKSEKVSSEYVTKLYQARKSRTTCSDKNKNQQKRETAPSHTAEKYKANTSNTHLVDDASVLHDSLSAHEAQVHLLHDGRHRRVQHHLRGDAAVREQPRALQATVGVVW